MYDAATTHTVSSGTTGIETSDGNSRPWLVD